MTIVNPGEFRDFADGWRVIWSRVGRTLVRNVCPFCGADVEAFLWSLAGCGKRCACGALLGRFCAFKERSK